MRFLLPSVTVLFLSSCWVGDGLYSNRDARQPIPAGTYRASSSGDRVEIENVKPLRNGLTQIGDGDGKAFYGFVPLDRQNRRFVAWFRKQEETAEDHEQLYLLLERRSAQEFVIFLPQCTGALAEIARKAGAEIQYGSPDVCHFSNRGTLEAAMRQVRVTGHVMRLERIR